MSQRRLQPVGWATAAAAALLCSAAVAQPAPFSETLQVELVEVEVRVLGRQGRPVTGLPRERFTVTEEGEAVEVAAFEEVGRSAGGPAAGAGDAGGGEELSGYPLALRTAGGELTPPGTTVVFFLDAAHMRPGSDRRVLPAVESFLDGMPPEDRAIVAVHDEGLRIVAGPTADRAVVLEAVTEALEASSVGARVALARREGYREIVRALICDRIPEPDCDACWQNAEAVAHQHARVIADGVERSLDALKTLVASLSGVPGRKTVLLLSDGMPQRPGLELFDYLAQVCSRYEREIARNYLAYDAMPAYLRLTSKAGANRATIYALETAGLEAGGSVQDDFYSAELPTRPSNRNHQMARANRQASLHTLADQTGGLALFDRNDLREAVARVEEDLAHRYVLAYRPNHPPCGREHRIAVEVAGQGNLRYREWYLHVQPEPRLVEILQASILYGIETDPMGVTLTAGEPSQAAGGRYVVPLRLTVPLAAIVLLPEGGELVGSLRLVVTGAGAGGERLPIKEKQVPVRLSPQVVKGGEAVHHDFEIDVDLTAGDWTLAVAFWDERTGTVGVKRSGVAVGGGAR